MGTTASIENPGNAYVLNKGSQGVGFYKLADGKTIGANKAYLTYDGGKGVKQFFLFDEATGIETIDNGQWTMDNGQLIMDNGQLDRSAQGDASCSDNVVYDLQGRRIVNGKLPKGLYMVNGKKMMIN